MYVIRTARNRIQLNDNVNGKKNHIANYKRWLHIVPFPRNDHDVALTKQIHSRRWKERNKQIILIKFQFFKKAIGKPIQWKIRPKKERSKIKTKSGKNTLKKSGKEAKRATTGYNS